jgi:hypothetical protein
MTGTSRRRGIAAAATVDDWCSSLVVDHRIERIGLGIDAPGGFRLGLLVALSSRQEEASWMGCLSAHVWAYESMTGKKIMLDYINFFGFRRFVLSAVYSSLILF